MLQGEPFTVLILREEKIVDTLNECRTYDFVFYQRRPAIPQAEIAGPLDIVIAKACAFMPLTLALRHRYSETQPVYG